jgi:hypothetical protein
MCRGLYGRTTSQVTRTLPKLILMQTQEATPAADIAKALNLECFCKTLDPLRLQAQLEYDLSMRGMAQGMAQSHPHLFSSTVVFLSSHMVHAIRKTVATIDRVMAMPTWQTQTLAHASAIAQSDYGPLGVFMGYDFHIGESGPQLIEINTNAGGALLNTALARAQTACCHAMDLAHSGYRNLATMENDFIAMFKAEWRLQRNATMRCCTPLPSWTITQPSNTWPRSLNYSNNSSCSTVSTR